MITDKDSNGNISITEIPPKVAQLLVDALTTYFQGKDLNKEENREEKFALHQLGRELSRLT